MTTLTTLRGQALRRLVRHYLEMVVAMVAGMVVLGPAESVLLDPIGWAELRAHPETRALIMATNMAVAMHLSFVVLFPPLWLGVLSATGLMVLGHVLMLFAMAAVMLRRRDQYT